MKLYQSNLSPFTSRVRIQVYAKGLEREITFVPPPGGAGSAEYKRINPTGRIPALAVDGIVLPESSVIFEYLEDRFPELPLRARDPLERARARVVAQYVDLYVFPALHELYAHVNPANRNATQVVAGLAALHPLLDVLDGLLTPAPYAVGRDLSLADCALMPVFFFATRVLPLLGDADPTAARANLARWWRAVLEHPAVQRVDAEMTQALAEYMAAPR
jgi:glutathione S-transferase